MIKPSLDKANINLSITVIWVYLYQQWVEPSLDKASINLSVNDSRLIISVSTNDKAESG